MAEMNVCGSSVASPHQMDLVDRVGAGGRQTEALLDLGASQVTFGEEQWDKANETQKGKNFYADQQKHERSD